MSIKILPYLFELYAPNMYMVFKYDNRDNAPVCNRWRYIGRLYSNDINNFKITDLEKLNEEVL